MGVSGCGKSEIGSALARRLGVDFIEGDAFHPQANLDKMAGGQALDDSDRHQWLLILAGKIRHAVEQGRGIVLSCSALKLRYRELLRAADPDLAFLHLQGERALIAERMAARAGHFMPLTLLDSQFRDLEPLAQDERGIDGDIRLPPAQLVQSVIEHTSYITSSSSTRSNQ
jgi:gluconokinase